MSMFGSLYFLVNNLVPDADAGGTKTQTGKGAAAKKTGSAAKTSNVKKNQSNKKTQNIGKQLNGSKTNDASKKLL